MYGCTVGPTYLLYIELYMYTEPYCWNMVFWPGGYLGFWGALGGGGGV